MQMTFMNNTLLKNTLLKTMFFILLLPPPAFPAYPPAAARAASTTGSGIGVATVSPADETSQDETPADETPQGEMPPAKIPAAEIPKSVAGDASEPVRAPDPPELAAGSAVLMDAGTGNVLYSKNMYVTEYPASVTKVLTALLALEAGEDDLEQRISFSRDAVYSLPYNSSNIAMNEGDTLSLSDALYGLLMASANEVANAVAEHFGGSAEGFADMMNRRAAELGAKNTHFVNPNGLHDPDHYTCAYDMALFMREAVKHPFFVKAISTVSYKIPPTETQPLERPLYNQDKMITPGKYFYEGVVGGKTGFTDEAQHTLVTYAAKDGIGLVAVVMDEAGMDHYTDTAALLDYGFGGFHEVRLFDAAGYSVLADVAQPYADGGGHTVKIKARAEAGVEGLFTLGADKSAVRLSPEFKSGLKAPIAEGDEIGTLYVMYGGAELASVKLLAAESVSLEQTQTPTAAPAARQAAEEPPDNGNAAGEATAVDAIMNAIKWILIIAGVVIFGLITAAVFLRRARRRRRKARALRYAPGVRVGVRRPRAGEWSTRRYR
ncbi:MAG: D-alanyl-D-alanine carboxypeptidase [Firmicutes bacterium]|nr:D-alanyl-D-alanine carboxypeptidase [Bacillota bacterium]